ncbi:hypothetical protein ACFE04_017345 [Oxalis oulophora]
MGQIKSFRAYKRGVFPQRIVDAIPERINLIEVTDDEWVDMKNALDKAICKDIIMVILKRLDQSSMLVIISGDKDFIGIFTEIRVEGHRSVLITHEKAKVSSRLIAAADHHTTWGQIMSLFVTNKDSLQMSCIIFRTSIYNILHIRRLIPQLSFHYKDSNRVKLMSHNYHSRTIIHWLDVSFVYSVNDTTIITLNQMRRSAATMQQSLVKFMHNLQKMPDERTILIKLVYCENVTPLDYEPPFFKGCSEEDEGHNKWTSKPLKMAVGNVNSNHLILTLKAKSVLHSCGVENNDIQDDEVSLEAHSMQRDGSSSDSDTEVSKTQAGEYIAAPVEIMYKLVKEEDIFSKSGMDSYPENGQKDMEANEPHNLNQLEAEESNVPAHENNGTNENSNDSEKANPMICSKSSREKRCRKTSMFYFGSSIQRKHPRSCVPAGCFISHVKFRILLVLVIHRRVLNEGQFAKNSSAGAAKVLENVWSATASLYSYCLYAAKRNFRKTQPDGTGVSDLPLPNHKVLLETILCRKRIKKE